MQVRVEVAGTAEGGVTVGGTERLRELQRRPAMRKERMLSIDVPKLYPLLYMYIIYIYMYIICVYIYVLCVYISVFNK